MADLHKEFEIVLDSAAGGWRSYVFPQHAAVRFVASSAQAHAFGAASPTEFGVWTNYPLENHGVFAPRDFARVPTFFADETPVSPLDGRAVIGSLRAARPGFFQFRLCRVDCDSAAPSATVFAGHFRVIPEKPPLPKHVPVSGLSVQTLIGHLLGPITQWSKHFVFARGCGYNAVHLTPVQPPGPSNSPYSLQAHDDINPAFFPADLGCDTPQKRVDYFKKFIDIIKRENQLAFVGDLVLPHMAVSSPVLRAHPEFCYNFHNSPHLKMAFVVDVALQMFLRNIRNGVYGPIDLKNAHDVNRAAEILEREFLPKFALWEFSVINADIEVAAFKPRLSSKYALNGNGKLDDDVIEAARKGIVIDPACERNMVQLSPEVRDMFCSEEALRAAINTLNIDFYKQYDEDIRSIVSAFRGTFHNNGEWVQYFEVVKPAREITMADVLGNLSEFVVITKHGWVMDANPFADNAGPGSRVYARRQLICWGDCAKLRYGRCYSDNPSLWEYMGNYAELMGTVFDGFRIDNCHSVDVTFLQYVLDRARAVNPNLFVFAELFSPSYDSLRVFTGSCGIDCLLQEGCQTRTQGALHELLYNCCGAALSPIGRPCASALRLGRTPAPPYPISSWIFDQTHDNEPITQVHSPEHALTLGALNAMCIAAVGSVRGVDELLPCMTHVVKCKTPYKLYGPFEQNPGICMAKKLFGELHERLALENFTEAYVASHGQLITAARHNPETLTTVHMLACCAFKDYNRHPYIPPITLNGKVTNINFFCSLDVLGSAPHETRWLEGIPARLNLHERMSIYDENPHFHVEHRDKTCIIHFKDFPAGAVLCVTTDLVDRESVALKRLNYLLHSSDVDPDPEKSVLRGLTLADMNILLYRCEFEENNESPYGSYMIPNYGKPTFSGFQGWQTIIQECVSKNPVDMGEPLFENLRQGDWVLDFTIKRLTPYPQFEALTRWLSACFTCVRALPRYLVPKYFSRVIDRVYHLCIDYCIQKMSLFVRNAASFVKKLALSSVQFYSVMKSAPFVDGALLPSGDSRLELAKKSLAGSLCAGLPHFCHGYMRSWGRDVFISFKGLLLVTGRFEEARALLVGGATVLRHGLMPNLIDSGRNPRYNARDATWWYMKSLFDYIDIVPNGGAILSEKVWRLFPLDEHPPYWSTVAEVVQEIMTCHANGIEFRERNAGPQIDDKMKSEGFNVKVTRDPETGFIFGGNALNCGTWMDKMGDSARAGNRGIPATPRDGAAIEIIAILYYSLRNLARLYKLQMYPHNGVKINATPDKPLLFSEWADQIKANFFRCFYVPLDPELDSEHDIDKALVNKRGIIKDTYKCSNKFGDYQLRPNSLVAIALAPELFEGHADDMDTAFKSITTNLLGKLGMKTLNQEDWAYCGDYTPEDTDDYKTSLGFNYHQGPEWVWPFGFYLKAMIVCQRSKLPIEVIKENVYSLLKPHLDLISSGPWYSLPELTNSNGKVCYASCRSQAWSCGTILEALSSLN